MKNNIIANLVLLIICGLLTSCHSVSMSNVNYRPSLTEERLERIVAPIKNWPESGPEGYSPEDWNHLISAAQEVQKYNPNSVEKALHSYQLKGCPYGKFQNISSQQQLENDTKLFLLMRVIFRIPESVPKDKFVGFGGWVPSASLVNSDGTMNPSWPVKWDEGHPILIAPYLGLQGIEARYDAAAEFDYCLTNYPMRDLSSFHE